MMARNSAPPGIECSPEIDTGRGDLFTTARLAQYLGCSERHVFNLRKRGLPCFEVGDMVRFDVAAVRRWLTAHQSGGAQPAPGTGEPAPQTNR